MINKRNFSKAYKEVLEILKYIPEIDYKKIPNDILENMEKEMDIEYHYEVIEFEDFSKQKMLKETETILSVFFRDYWATQEQRDIIKTKEIFDIQKSEEEKSKQYDINDMFRKNKNSKVKVEDNHPAEVQKQKFFKKLIICIKKFLKIDY